MILPPSKAPTGVLEPSHSRHLPVECPTLPHGSRAHRSHRTACLHRNPQHCEDRSDKRLPVHSFVVFKGHDISPRTLVFILQYHTENLSYKRNVIFCSLPIPTPEDFFSSFPPASVRVHLSPFSCCHSRQPSSKEHVLPC